MFQRARAMITGLGIGAGWMYFFDPQAGKRRRALVRDQTFAALNDAACWFDKALRDAAHRMEGTVAAVQGMLDFSIPSDQQLSERVRACLGHVASHPRLIEVQANQGGITLAGHAPADELENIVSCVAGVRGVRSVDNQLDTQLGPDVTHDGQRRRRIQPSMDLMRESWAPSTRLIAGSAGTVLMLNCLARRTPGAVLMGTLGFGLFIRAVGNRDVGELIEEGTAAAQPMMGKVQGIGRRTAARATR
ncbi:MAG TPA: BON domain-containing protein [Pirellulales bacterium]|nr:BON domain-containing protein [Pirellulales bacterium]